MNRCGLGPAEFKLYADTLTANHSVQVAVDLRDKDGNVLVSFDEGRGGGRNVVVLGGSVAVDATQPVGRVLTLSVADPDKVLLVGQDPSFTSRQLQVRVGVPVAALNQVVWCDVFTGPIYSAVRAGDVVEFIGHGKARYAMHGIGAMYTVVHGIKKTDAIKKILNVLAGELAVAMGGIPDLPDILANDIIIRTTDRPNLIVKGIALSLGRDLAWDGSGNVRMPLLDETVVAYTFAGGTNQTGVVGAQPQQQTDWSQVKNSVKITGGVPVGGGAAPVAYAYAPAANPFSAQTLGRNGADAYLWDERTITTVKTQATAQRIADATLTRDLIANRSIKFESMPIYPLDELDFVELVTVDAVSQTHLAQFTIPLDLSGAQTMSLGWNDRVSSNRFARRG